MNTLLSRRIGGFLLAASLLSLAACQQDPQSANGPESVLPLSAGTPAAHPAITYTSSVVSHNSTYATVGVMDTNAANQTNIVTATSTSTWIVSPSWSATGASIAWAQGLNTGASASQLEALDVSVNSKGVPAGANVRTIYSTSNADSMSVNFPAWCSVSSTGKIAFVRQHIGSLLGESELCTVSQSGGSETVLQTVRAYQWTGNYRIYGRYRYPTWSPDDSKIAVVRTDTDAYLNTPWHQTILIVDAASGAVTDSIPLAMNVSGLQWSRTGTNQLVFSARGTSGSFLLYYCASSTGSTPTTNSVVGTFPTWSPNNSGVAYLNSGLQKNVPFTSTTSTVSSSFTGSYPNWKR